MSNIARYHDQRGIREEGGFLLAIGCDHAGYPLKVQILDLLREMDVEVYDAGCYDQSEVDYPVYANAVAEAVLSGMCGRGILICGTGIGISIAANRHEGIRCALCTDAYSARMARSHNDANILALGARVIGAGVAGDIVQAFLSTPFTGERHVRRIKIFDKKYTQEG